MIKTFLHTLYHLFFPNVCVGCAQNLLSFKKTICYYCKEKLPITNFQEVKNNLVFEKIQEKISIENACSIYFFQKNSILRNIIHQFKYYGKLDVAFSIGEFMGTYLSKSSLYKDIDAVTAIPLYYKKLKKRGYNQSEILAQGIVNILKKPLYPNLLTRNKNTKIQASLKTTEQREKNLESSFVYHIKKEKNINHLLIIDDVFTTGATIVSAIKEIQQKSNVKISVCTLAFTFD